MGKYDDIIDLPHHVSDKHLQMSIYNRAAQFAPFAALTGYDDAICETARITDRKLELDEYEKERIERILQYINENIEDIQEIKVTYFVPDSKKTGGAYIDYIGRIRRIDDVFHKLIMIDGKTINIDDILEMNGEWLEMIDFDE